jgi:hypothetical protein
LRAINLSQEFVFAAEESKLELAAIAEPSFISILDAVESAAVISRSGFTVPAIFATPVAKVTMKNNS